MWAEETTPQSRAVSAFAALQRVVDGLVRRLTPSLLTASSCVASLSSRLSAVRNRLAPRTSLPVNLAVSLALIGSLRVAGSCLLPRKKQLRQRSVMLARVRQVVDRWETAVEEEVLYRCTGIVSDEAAASVATCCGADPSAARHLAAAWTDAAAAHHAPDSDGPFQGIVASVTFAPDFDLASYVELVYTADQVLTIGADKMWVERLTVIVLFAIFRRLAVAEEARHMASLWYRYVLNRAHHPAELPSRVKGKSSTEAWRVFGRPTWLVPLALVSSSREQGSRSQWQRRFRCYLGMPLAYFPVASILTYMAEETWLRPGGCITQALSRWQRHSRAALRLIAQRVAAPSTKARPIGLAHTDVRKVVVSSKVYYLFLRYGHPLALEQVRLAEADAQRFVAEKLFRGVRVTSLYGDHGVKGLAPSTERCGSVLRERPRERRIRTLNLACTLCQALTAFMNAWLPHLNTADLMCVVSLTVFRPRPEAPTGPVDTPAASTGASESADASAVEGLAAQLVWHLITSAVTGVVEVCVSRVTTSLRASLSNLLSEELAEQVASQLHAVDEAFLGRLVNDIEASSPHIGGQQQRPSQHEPTAKESVAQIVRSVEAGGGSLVAYHYQRVRRMCSLAAMAGFVLYYREPASLIIACLMSADTQTLLGTLTQKVGFSSLDDFASCAMYGSAEDALPSDRPVGLALVLDVLAEDHADGSALTHPFLALLTCSAVWQHARVVAESGTDGEAVGFSAADANDSAEATAGTPPLPPLPTVSVPRPSQIATLYRAVVAHRYDRYGPRSRLGYHRFVSRRHLDDRVASMLLDVQCILAYPVAEMCEKTSTHTGVETCARRRPHTIGRLTASDGGPCLDATEVELVHSQAAATYVPRTVDYFDLFTAPTRFVLRQLGLEMIFAERTVACLRQSAPQDASAELEELFSSASFNPITWLLTDLVDGVQSFIVVTAACGLWRNGCLYIRPTDPQRVYAQYGRVQRYRRLFSVYRRSSGYVQNVLAIRRLQQLCECMPSSISDESPLSHCADVVARRQAWVSWLTATRVDGGFDGRPRVDACGRVCGHFRVHRGVTLHDVYFAYSQLHHYTTSTTAPAPSLACEAPTGLHHVPPSAGMHRPVLRGLSCSFPAHGMTAIIGPTGSGKSSTVGLLTRHYDALPPLCVDANESTWTDELLGQLLYMQAVEATLPLPPPLAHEAPPSGTAFHQDERRAFLLHQSESVCGVRIDGIPVACFSVAYLRQWAAHLEQSPHIFEKMSFFDNVRLFHPGVTYAEAAEAATVCRCAPFIKDKQQQLFHQAGTLSGGEQQRLALARVVAAARARVREERLPAPYCEEVGMNAVATQEDTAADGILLLDEPTSRLDAYNELQILESIETLARGSWGGIRLLIVAIAHRLSTLRAAQHVVVVENGVVSGEGEPKDVMERSAFAREQMRLQEVS